MYTVFIYTLKTRTEIPGSTPLASEYTSPRFSRLSSRTSLSVEWQRRLGLG